MSAIETISGEVATLRAQLAGVAERIALADIDEAIEAMGSVRVAREWAKVRKLSEEMHHELLWIEAVALRRMGLIGEFGAIPKYLRTTAEHLAPLSNEDLRRFLADNDSSTVVGCYRRLRKNESARREFDEGTRWARGDRADYGEGEYLDSRVDAYVTDLRGALAAVMDSLFLGDVPRSVLEISTVLVEEYLPDYAEDREVIRAVSSVVREALISAPVPEEFRGLPRFVPCQRPGGQWLRVPIHTMTFGQMEDYLALRREQAQQQVAATERLANALTLARTRFANRVHRDPMPGDGINDSYSVPLDEDRAREIARAMSAFAEAGVA